MSSSHPFSDARPAATSPPFGPERRVASTADGSVEAFDALYDHYVVRAFAVAWSIVGTTPNAEDALRSGTEDFWRHCTQDRPTVVSGGWLLCRVSDHALDDRRRGRCAPGRLSGLTDPQCQVLALACAGRMSRIDIATETERSSAAVARAMTEALVRLRAGPRVRATDGPGTPPPATHPERRIGAKE